MVKRIRLSDLPHGLWAEMRYCMEEEIAQFDIVGVDAGLGFYPELTHDLLPVFQRMIRAEHRNDQSIRQILRLYDKWLGDLLSSYYDESIYAPELGYSEDDVQGGDQEASEWVRRLEGLQTRLLGQLARKKH